MGGRTNFANIDIENISLEDLTKFDFSEISFDFNEEFYGNGMKRFATFFLTKAYDKWNNVTGYEHLEQIPKDVPVAFISTHREHSDYFIFALMLYLKGWGPPERKFVKIAAGENLYLKLPHRLFPFLNIDKWIRQAGGFQVYRKANQSEEEKKYLNTRLTLFVSKLIADNESILSYPDSGRAVSGRSKFNPAAIDLWVTGQRIAKKDSYIAPLAVSYEKDPSDRYFTYFKKIKETKKKRELTLREKINYYLYDLPGLFSHVLTKDLGNAYTNIGEPILIHASDIPDAVLQRAKYSVRLNKQIQKKCEELIEVTSTALFCRAVKKLQNNTEGKLYLPDLVSKITEEREQLKQSGARIGHVQDSEDVAKRAIGFLCTPFRRMIHNSGQCVQIVRQDVINYYANNIAHFK